MFLRRVKKLMTEKKSIDLYETGLKVSFDDFITADKHLREAIDTTIEQFLDLFAEKTGCKISSLRFDNDKEKTCSIIYMIIDEDGAPHYVTLS